MKSCRRTRIGKRKNARVTNPVRGYSSCAGDLLQECNDRVLLSKPPTSSSSRQSPLDSIQEVNKPVSSTSQRASSAPKHKYAAQLQRQREHRRTIEYSGTVVYLRQEHFRRGMLEITQNGYVWTGKDGEIEKVTQSTAMMVFRLEEDITFEPSARADKPCGLDTFRPTPEQIANYSFPSALRLGWFAAIACSAQDVVIDLNGYELKQGKTHYLLQRFHSLIELASAPFIPPQGPQNFGSLHAAQRVAVINGKLGLSSHHGVHSNDTVDVLLENLSVRSFEVAAIQMNGAQNLCLCNIDVTHNCQECPVVGTFSAGVFMYHICQTLPEERTVSLAGVVRTAGDIRNKLRGALNEVIEDFLAGGRIDARVHPESAALFTNSTGEIDGPSYGIILNSSGVAINGFPMEAPYPSRNVYMRDIRISNLTGRIREVLALRVGPHSDRFQTDGAGAVFQQQNVSEISGNLLTINAAAEYVGNVVSDAQLLAAQLALEGENVPAGTITQDTLQWAAGGAGSGQTLFVATVPEWLLGSYFFNADSMHHTAKGMIACKLDGIDNLLVEYVTIQAAHNNAERGITDDTMPVRVTQKHVPGYMQYLIRRGKSNATASLNGYSGADMRGISLSATSNAALHAVNMSNISSMHGQCTAIDVLGKSKSIDLQDIVITGVQAGVCRENLGAWWGNPTSLPIAYGIHINPLALGVAMINVQVSIAYSHFDDVGIRAQVDNSDETVYMKMNKP